MLDKDREYKVYCKNQEEWEKVLQTICDLNDKYHWNGDTNYSSHSMHNLDLIKWSEKYSFILIHSSLGSDKKSIIRTDVKVFTHTANEFISLLNGFEQDLEKVRQFIYKDV